jgi:hypothetical protein
MLLQNSIIIIVIIIIIILLIFLFSNSLLFLFSFFYYLSRFELCLRWIIAKHLFCIHIPRFTCLLLSSQLGSKRSWTDSSKYFLFFYRGDYLFIYFFAFFFCNWLLLWKRSFSILTWFTSNPLSVIKFWIRKIKLS